MKTTQMILWAAVVALGLFLPVSFGQKAPDGPGRPGMALQQILRDGQGPLERVEKLLEELGLTDAQKAQVKTILEDAKTKWETWRDAHKDAIEKLKEEIKAARQAKDRDKLPAILEQAKELLKDAPKGEALQAIKDVLTPEQKEKLEAKLKELREKVQERRAANETAPAK